MEKDTLIAEIAALREQLKAKEDALTDMLMA